MTKRNLLSDVQIDSIKIFKYEIPLNDEVEILMPGPEDSEILCVQVQKQGSAENVCIWAKVDTTAKLVKRTFFVIGTGNPWTVRAFGAKYIGTFQVHGGRLVFHLFVKE